MTSFDEDFTALFELAEQVLKYNPNGEFSMRTSNIDPVATRIRKYRQAYERTKSSGVHKAKFRELYDQCKKKFNEIEEFDNFMLWFEKQTFSIQATESVYFPITIVFRKCCTISRSIEAHGKTKAGNDDPEHVGTTYPEQFMLHLFSLFQSSATTKDPKVEEQVRSLEYLLRLKEGEKPDPADGLADVVNLATDVIGDMGINIPKGAFNPADFTKAINGFAKNSDAKEQMKSLFSGVKIKDQKDLPGMFTQLFDKMKTTAEEMPEPLKRSMNASVENPTGELASGSGSH